MVCYLITLFDIKLPENIYCTRLSAFIYVIWNLILNIVPSCENIISETNLIIFFETSQRPKYHKTANNSQGGFMLIYRKPMLDPQNWGHTG